jgi:hypothetical protein
LLRRLFSADFDAGHVADLGGGVGRGDVEFARPDLLFASANSQKRCVLLHVEVSNNVREFG